MMSKVLCQLTGSFDRQEVACLRLLERRWCG